MSTRAVCTPPAVGRLVRCTDAGSSSSGRFLPRGTARSRCSMRSGSGVNRRSHLVTGQPVARPPLWRIDFSTASRTMLAPAASASALFNSRALASGTFVGTLASPNSVFIECATLEMSDDNRFAAVFFSRTVVAIVLRSVSMPMPVKAEAATQLVLLKPSESSNPRRSRMVSRSWSPVSRSAWLSTTSITPAWSASGFR
ncbi:hypothetical protein SDC9_112836 [bioreactor metagenome]|uniref:Uncharacterized protein n=1 Tax=bioreactor metagenome TaxID=1076179 RepID=A0A645BL56_9ZZZZ